MLYNLDTYALLTDVESLEDLVEAYIERPTLPVALDLETTGLNFLEDKVITVQLMQFAYLPVIFDVRHWTRSTRHRAARALQKLADTTTIVGMNLSFDIKFMRRVFNVAIHRCYDVMLTEQVIRGLGRSGGRIAGIAFDLKSIAARYGIYISKEERNIFINMHQREAWYQPLPESSLAYAARDVEILETIYYKQLLEIKERLLVTAANIENGALPAITSVEYNGVYIAAEPWADFIAGKETEAERLNAQAYEILGAVIAENRAKRYRKAMKHYQAWCKERDQLEAEAKEVYEESDKSKKFQTFKKQYMQSWRSKNPNPGRPKLETHSLYIKWLEDREHYARTLKEQYNAQEQTVFLEEYKQTCLEKWEQENPEPEPDVDINQARQMCYAPINLSSPQQLLEALQSLKIPVKSTSKEALAELPEGLHPAVDLLKAYREAQVFPTKFGASVLNSISPVTGRIHPVYLSIGADTGRMSCSNPPWQQIPAKGDGATLRTFVRAEPGNKLLIADFSNIELRILADVSGDKAMLDAFASGVDLHSYTARKMYKLPDDVDVKKELVPGTNVTYRQAAKVINFGLVYGMSASGLARTLKLQTYYTEDGETVTASQQAKALMNAYFAAYPGVARWLEEQRRKGVTNMESRTVTGRVRYYEVNAPKHSREYKEQLASIERKAMNSPVQGSSADITKIALANLYQEIYKRGWIDIVKIVLVVHDEIGIEAPEELVNDVSEMLAKTMYNACTSVLKRVTIPQTEVVIGDYWSKE